MTISQALHATTKKLAAYLNNQISAGQEARWLLSHALNIDMAQLLGQLHRILSTEEAATYEALIHKRIHEHKPLAYILGNAPFCGLTLAIQPPILIPRHETEELVQYLITLLKPYQERIRILDLCTGSGAIALALAHHLPHAYIMGTDISDEALYLAQENQNALAITNVTFVKANLYQNLPEDFFDLIISNPPYLSTQEWEILPPDVKKWESPLALTSGPSGMEIYEDIVINAHHYLRSARSFNDLPELVLEHGSEQQSSVNYLLKNAHFTEQNSWQDSFNKDRAILAKRPPKN